MFINWKKRELNLNIIYYGPALSGKTTNLQQIHARTQSAARSELFTLNTHEDRTIFFDFMQLEIGQVGGLLPKFGLYTVPGQVYYESTREAVLRRADALVFVADSQKERMDDNLTSWGDMLQQLARMNRSLKDMPTIVQFNKRDLPGALSVEALKSTLGVGPLPCFEAVAMRGIGVPETLQMTMRVLLAYVQRKLLAQVKRE
ncbi:MAG: GTPase domain-containing protein [Anaerolineae bacterium]|nr:GTPase domain-containing protein [Anaerolineae bacterium]